VCHRRDEVVINADAEPPTAIVLAQVQTVPVARAGAQGVGSDAGRVATGVAAELQSLLGSKIVRWGEVIRRAKIEPE
jgi:hypothetical protein